MTIKLRGSTDGSVSLTAPADTSPTGTDITLTLPTDAGSANQFLKNSGTAGTLDYSSMVEDSSGNIGVGTTSNLLDGSNRTTLSLNNTGSAAVALGVNGTREGHILADANSMQVSAIDNYMYFTAGGSERMRIDTSGRLLVGAISSNPTSSGEQPFAQVAGTDSRAGLSLIRFSNDANGGGLYIGKSRGTSVGANTVVNNGDELGRITFSGNDGTDTNTISARIQAFVDGATGSNDMPGRLVFSTTADGASSPTERMRISRLGQTKFTSNTNNNNGTVLYARHEGTSGSQYGVLVQTANDQNDTTRYFLSCLGNSTARATIRSNGGLANYQSNNVNLCDEREKKNIETLDSTWGCLKNWELKKFHYNEDPDTDDKRYGVIAQQVEQHCPELINDWIKQNAEEAVLDEDGNVVTPAQEEILRKGVKEQQMMWMAIKALQEAQDRIETLEAKVATLEAA